VAEIDSAGALEFWFTHGIISESSYHGVRDHCDFAKINPLASLAVRGFSKVSKAWMHDFLMV
jgi:hypothetical protein